VHTNEPEPSGTDERPTVGDEAPSTDRPRFVLPPIDRARLVGALVKVGIIVTVASVTSVALGVAAFAATSAYGQYGAVRNTPNAQSWAALTPRYSEQAICTACHGPEAGLQDASIHVNVSCETCHGPLAAHAVSDAAAREGIPGKPTNEICVTCHAVVAGRPATFPQIDEAQHYSGGPCLRCHDPHSIVAVRPSIVSHPLANLPECPTCHAPDGLRKIPTGHEIVSDAICLSCHGQAAAGKR